ncbi:uncharacterized protein LOC111405269 isoform X1 [Olea europaea var. sylvestris]|uniref:uncharacterized protein LOC111405269 isoform X1 n=2 Tax=Olea europaea var. sylvestris TaxID=158386 RepID=UPI000C1D1F05|nr:uncharacterized protein LOC111405269 isoform X1 [Olea europaea var. sylvestris]
MFTEGLDKNALKWVSEGSASRNKENSYIPNQRPRLDPLSSIGNRGRGIGLPPPSKFQSGHLPGVISMSGIIPGDSDGSRSVSDNDMTTDSEEEVYGGRYSLDSSPQNDRILSRSATSQRYYKPVQRHAPQYANESMVSDDVSSSRETNSGCWQMEEKQTRGANRYPNNAYSEDGSSYSDGSSEFSTMQSRSANGTLPQTRAYVSEGYASRIPPEMDAHHATGKDVTVGTSQNKNPCDDIPSAPPFCASVGEIKQDGEHIPAYGTHDAESSADSHAFPAKPCTSIDMSLNTKVQDNVLKNSSYSPVRTAVGVESCMLLGPHPTRRPTFHESPLGSWHAVIAYDACVRLCLHAWAKGCMEAPMFLENECFLLRDAFGLQQVLLQSEEEMLVKRSSDLPTEGAAPNPKKMVGKMKVQVKRVKFALDPPEGCSCSTIKAPKVKMDNVRHHLLNMWSKFSSGWRAVHKIHFEPRAPANASFSHQSLASLRTSTQYLKQVSGLLKVGVTSTLRSRSSSDEVLLETHSFSLRLKSSAEEDAIKMQPGSGDSHMFFPDSLGDDLIVEVLDSKGNHYGRVIVQVAAIADNPGEKQRWWPIYREPEHECVGKLQLYINYSASLDDNSHLKCGSIAETVAYDLVLEVAMKIQDFHQRNLLLHGPWKWLLAEFASYYGVSPAYTKLRYLSYVMDVVTPTSYCLKLVYDLLLPVVMKGHSKSALSHQENRILKDIEDQIEPIFSLVFENYKSLDESSSSGILDVFMPATGVAAPVLEPAVKLYSLLHDILAPEAQTKLYSYFQAAAKKRARKHLSETDEYVSGSNDSMLMDAVTVSTAYQKMKSNCSNIRNEIFTDIEIHNQNILPSFIDLPNLSSAVYSTELCSRLRAFLVACPPPGPASYVTELLVATADFQKDLTTWNIKPVKGGVDAKELFHLYIILWIQDKRLSLLESCKLDKVKWSGVTTQHLTTPFIDDMYDRLNETLNNYDVIICRWPEYTCVLENAIADIEKAILDALEKQYADVLAPLKEKTTARKSALKYVQEFTKRSSCPYVVPNELGILLNSMKRMVEVLCPKIEHKLKARGSCIPDRSHAPPGDRLSEITVMLRSKFRNYLQAVVEKLVENTRLQGSTKLKKILLDSKKAVADSDVKGRMQPLRDQLINTISHLHTILESHVFVAICRGYWDRMGKDVQNFLEERKENKAWYKGSRIAVSVSTDLIIANFFQLII